jgi:hypothetical protein
MSELRIFKLKDLGYMEAMDIMENKGRCPYCKRFNKDDQWVRTSFVSPGLCVDSAPRCVDCPGRPARRRRQGSER